MIAHKLVSDDPTAPTYEVEVDTIWTDDMRSWFVAWAINHRTSTGSLRLAQWPYAESFIELLRAAGIHGDWWKVVLKHPCPLALQMEAAERVFGGFAHACDSALEGMKWPRELACQWVDGDEITKVNPYNDLVDALRYIALTPAQQRILHDSDQAWCNPNHPERIEEQEAFASGKWICGEHYMAVKAAGLGALVRPFKHSHGAFALPVILEAIHNYYRDWTEEDTCVPRMGFMSLTEYLRRLRLLEASGQTRKP